MSTENTYATREEWLQSAVELLRDLFPVEVPAYRVSVGFPTGRGSNKHKTIGECHYMSADKVPQVFISPVLTDPVEVLAVLIHEVIHAALPVGTGHKGQFVTVAKAMGLEGKMTATVPGEGLKIELAEVAKVLGHYPHAALDLSNAKKQTTRQIKATCARHEEGDYVVRISMMQALRGLPICPLCHSEEGEVVEMALTS